MNKLSIVTVVALASIVFVSAEENNAQKSSMMKTPVINKMVKQEGKDNVMPRITTGDVVIDAQVKALNDEMEAKIKAIRDEYILKIKAIVVGRASSTTTKMMSGEHGEKRGFDEGRKMGVPFIDNTLSTATDTPLRGPIMRVQNEDDKNIPSVTPGIMSFFRGLFGGNR